MIEIMNMHHIEPSEPYDVKVDRSSVLGNPFIKNEIPNCRNRVCEEYEIWFEEQLKDENTVEFAKEIGRLEHGYQQYGRLRLFCWCAPKRCHAETIRNYILELYK